MARITWTDAAPVDGTTVLTSARWEQLKTDVGAQVGIVAGAAGNLDASNMAAGFLTRVLMATGNRDVTEAITIPLIRTTLAVATDVGFTQAAGAGAEIYGPIAKVDKTLMSVDYIADGVATNPALVQPMRAGVAVGVADTLAVLATPQVVEREYSGIAYTDGQRIGIIVNGSGGTTNVRGGSAVLRFVRPLA